MDETWDLYVVSNTHWDREWYLGLYAFNHRLVKLMDRLLDLLRERPGYRGFLLDGQVLPVDDYLAIRPERGEEIRRLVRDGRLHIGPLYCQASETLASGESLVRNFLLGLRRCAALGGSLPACYLIDQLGHVSQLPQIARGFGFEEVVLWRGVPEDAPSTFSWVGPDGSRVLLFHVNDGYGDSTALPDDDAGLAERVRAVLALRIPRATTRCLLSLNGVDHSFAQANITELIGRMDRLVPSVRARHATLPEYLRAVRRAHDEEGKPFAEVRGEFMKPSDTWADVHSFRTDLKARASRVERLLERWAEPFAAIGWALGLPYPHGELWKAWELVLQNQSHDTIGASSVDQVRGNVTTRFDWAQEIAEEAAAEGLQAIANAAARTEPPAEAGAAAGADDPGDAAADQRIPLAVFNPLSWERSEPVTAAVDVPAAWGWKAVRVLDGGREVACDLLERRETVARAYNPFRGWPTFSPVLRFTVRFPAADVPCHGYKVFRLAPAEAPRPKPTAARPPGIAENGFLRVEARADGGFDLLVKATGRWHRGLHVFEDGGEAGTGFKHLAPRRDRIVTSLGCRATVADEGSTDLCSVLRIETELEVPASLEPDRQGRAERTAACRFATTVSLPAGVPRADVAVRVLNGARDHRLRLLLPLGRPAGEVRAEQPFDVVRREAILPPRYLAFAQARCLQAFVDVADGEGGLTIASDGLYEYEVLDDGRGTVALTLLRCTDRLDLGGHYDADDERIPLGQEPGEHEFRYSLVPHDGDPRASYRQAWGFRSPLRAVVPRPMEEEVLPDWTDPTSGARLPLRHSFVEVTPSALAVTAIKRAEERGTLVVRVLNTGDEPVRGSIRVRLPGRPVAGAWLLDLKEDRLRRLPVDLDGPVAVEVAGRGLATVEAELVGSAGAGPGGPS